MIYVIFMFYVSKAYKRQKLEPCQNSDPTCMYLPWRTSTPGGHMYTLMENPRKTPGGKYFSYDLNIISMKCGTYLMNLGNISYN